MSKKRRRYSAEYKFRVALEAAKGTKTLAEIATETGVHPNQISQPTRLANGKANSWKREPRFSVPTLPGNSASAKSRKPHCTSRSGV